MSVLLLLGFFIRAKLTALFRSSIHKTSYEDEKKFQIKGLLIVWAISTIAIFVLVAFFTE